MNQLAFAPGPKHNYEPRRVQPEQPRAQVVAVRTARTTSARPGGPVLLPHLIMTFKTFRPAAMVVKRTLTMDKRGNHRYFAEDCTPFMEANPDIGNEFFRD